MKRLIAVVMAVCMVFCIAACGETESGDSKVTDTSAKVKITDKNAGEFRVGFGRSYIMPEYNGVPLGGYGNTHKRLSTGYLDKLTASCTAISDANNNTVLVYSIDLIGLTDTMVAEWTKQISKTTGVPEKNIYLNCSHTHSAPDTTQTRLGTLIEYDKALPGHFLDAAVEALNSRVPSKVYFGETQTSGLNFVRHYLRDDGLALGDNHNDVDFTGKLIKHMTESDHTLYVVKFDRGNEKDVLWGSFRAHPTLTGGNQKTDISADWVGWARKTVEEQNDCWYSYMQGAAGNQNAKSRIDAENAKYNSDYQKVGEGIATYTAEILKNLTEVKVDKVSTKRQMFSAAANHKDDAKITEATIVNDFWNQTNNSTETKRLAQSFGIASQYHASAIISNSKRGANISININVLSIGELALTFVPFEQFDTNARFITENSPFKYTIALGYTNGKNGYIPSAYGYEYGCYEADTTHFAPGTGESVADTLVDMLKQIKLASN